MSEPVPAAGQAAWEGWVVRWAERMIHVLADAHEKGNITQRSTGGERGAMSERSQRTRVRPQAPSRQRLQGFDRDLGTVLSPRQTDAREAVAALCRVESALQPLLQRGIGDVWFSCMAQGLGAQPSSCCGSSAPTPMTTPRLHQGGEALRSQSSVHVPHLSLGSLRSEGPAGLGSLGSGGGSGGTRRSPSGISAVGAQRLQPARPEGDDSRRTSDTPRPHLDSSARSSAELTSRSCGAQHEGPSRGSPGPVAGPSQSRALTHEGNGRAEATVAERLRGMVTLFDKVGILLAEQKRIICATPQELLRGPLGGCREECPLDGESSSDDGGSSSDDSSGCSSEASSKNCATKRPARPPGR